MAIDTTRVKRTRSGYDVRIYAKDAGGAYSIHGAVLAEKEWQLHSWDLDGKYCPGAGPNKLDLIEEPQTAEIDVWLNVYSDLSINAFDTRADADSCCGSDCRFACFNIRRPIIEGEGL